MSRPTTLAIARLTFERLNYNCGLQLVHVRHRFVAKAYTPNNLLSVIKKTCGRLGVVTSVSSVQTRLKVEVACRRSRAILSRDKNQKMLLDLQQICCLILGTC